MDVSNDGGEDDAASFKAQHYSSRLRPPGRST